MNLDQLRSEIDKVDEEILDLLKKRQEIARMVGAFKKKNGIKPLQQERWKEVLNSRLESGKNKGLSPELVESIWQKIHDDSLDKQRLQS